MLDGVPQGVVRVVSGVRSDRHVRQPVQPQQQSAVDGPVAAIGIEDSFLAFEDVQRRAAQSAALQGADERLGIEKCTASGVDNERAVLHALDAFAVQEMACLGGEWRMERHDVALVEQCTESDVVGVSPRARVIRARSAAKPTTPVDDRAADASGSDYADGEVTELFPA